MSPPSDAADGTNTTTTPRSKQHAVALHWFRNGLRLHDNPSLLQACHDSRSLLPLVVIDPSLPFAQTSALRPGPIRVQFALESVSALAEKILHLSQSNQSQLVIVLGTPERMLPDVAAPVRESDQAVLRAIIPKGSSKNSYKNYNRIKIRRSDTHSLHPMETYLALCPGGVAPSSYGLFTKKVFGKLPAVPSEVETVTTLPPLPENALQRLQEALGRDVVRTTVPSLEELGYNDTEALLENRSKGGIDFIGGEDEGLLLLERMMKRTQWVAQFEKPKTSPNALVVDTTGLSPYVKHGCLSPRRFYHELSRVYSLFDASKISQPPVSLHGQLLWREYNYLTGYSTPKFDRMVGNPIARQIPWDDDPALVHAWRNSQTGYPFIDAIMTQLRHTGWIHHLARHAVACFLTRGDLWQSWEQGAAIFEELLVDADWSINNFNWQWLSCTAHFYQYFRCYSPIAFGKKTDPNGDYIRKWLPQLKRLPKKYIYEPWLAPIHVQQQCGVIVGESFPLPIVDHAIISKSNMQRMKLAYDAHHVRINNDNHNNDNNNNIININDGNAPMIMHNEETDDEMANDHEAGACRGRETSRTDAQSQNRASNSRGTKRRRE